MKKRKKVNKMERIKKKKKKKMCKIAKNLGAKRIGNSCYQYESVVQSNRKLIETLGISVCKDNFGYDNGYIYKQQLYYSCGTYGNSVQLHLITYVNNYGVEFSCYVYYTDYNYNKD